MVKGLKQEIEIPSGVELNIEGFLFKFKGPKGQNEKRIAHPHVLIQREENKIVLSTKKATKEEKMILNTLKANIQNLIKGVTEGYTYALKICSGHFPITVTADKEKVSIKNFLGEKIPRVAKIIKGVDVKIAGDIINISGTNKDLAGQTAANIESSTRITNRDRRRFQDGCFIIEKCGQKI